VTLLAWLLVYVAKSSGFGEVRRALERSEIVNLNAIQRVEPIDTLLRAVMPDDAERAAAAAAVFRQTPAGGARRALENVGALASLKAGAPADSTRRLFTREQLQVVKPLFVVREAGRFPERVSAPRADRPRRVRVHARRAPRHEPERRSLAAARGVRAHRHRLRDAREPARSPA